MKIEEAFARYLGQEVLVYTVSQGGSLSSVIDCTLEEIGDGWVRVTQGDDRNESIVNTANIIRIREYPRNKNGTLNGDEGPIMVQGGTTNLIGCKISTKYTPVYVSRGTANITDCTLTNEDANKSVVINNTGTVNISGTKNISSTIYKNPNSKYLPHVLAGTYNFDPTDFVDSEKFTITQSGENWIVAEKSQRR